MTLTSKVAKDLNLIIENTLFDYGVDRMIENIKAFKKRGKISNEEAKYLLGKVDEKQNGDVSSEVIEIQK